MRLMATKTHQQIAKEAAIKAVESDAILENPYRGGSAMANIFAETAARHANFKKKHKEYILLKTHQMNNRFGYQYEN